MVAILSSSAKNSNITISGGGLVATDGGGATDHAGRGDTTTTAIGSGVQIYFEVTPTALSTSFGVGVANSTNTYNDGEYLGGQANGLAWFSNGAVYSNGSQIDTVGSYTGSDVLGVAVIGHDQLWFSVNGVFTGDPVAETGGIALGAIDVHPAYNLKGGGVATFNFGATAFAATPPAGFSGFDAPGPLAVVPGEAQIVGATLGVLGVSGLEIVIIPGLVEIVGASLSVAGTFEPVEVVAGLVEAVGTVPTVNATAAAVFVVPGEVAIEGATLGVLTTNVVIVPGEISVVGATATIAASAIVDVVPGIVQIEGKTVTIVAAADSDFPVLGTPYIGPHLTGLINVGGAH